MYIYIYIVIYAHACIVIVVYLFLCVPIHRRKSTKHFRVEGLNIFTVKWIYIGEGGEFLVNYQNIFIFGDN